MKEKIKETLIRLGFHLVEFEEVGWYGFNYEGNSYLYLYDYKDENYLCISIPFIFDLQDDNAATFVALEEKLNLTSKYVKASKMGNSLWLFCERELLGEEDLELVLRRLIMRLDTALLIVEQFFASMEENTVNNDYEEQTDYVEEVDESDENSMSSEG